MDNNQLYHNNAQQIQPNAISYWQSTQIQKPMPDMCYTSAAPNQQQQQQPFEANNTICQLPNNINMQLPNQVAYSQPTTVFRPTHVASNDGWKIVKHNNKRLRSQEEENKITTPQQLHTG